MDGHIIGIEKTPDTYDTDKFLSSLTGLPVERTDEYYPDYRELLPEDKRYDRIRELLGDIEDDLQSVIE